MRSSAPSTRTQSLPNGMLPYIRCCGLQYFWGWVVALSLMPFDREKEPTVLKFLRTSYAGGRENLRSQNDLTKAGSSDTKIRDGVPVTFSTTAMIVVCTLFIVNDAHRLFPGREPHLRLSQTKENSVRTIKERRTKSYGCPHANRFQWHRCAGRILDSAVDHPRRNSTSFGVDSDWVYEY